MIFIIRQPLNAYPSLGNAVDGSLSTNKFSFIFSGDKLASYIIYVKDAYTNAAVYTGSSTPLVLYNGELFEAAIPAGSFANGRDLIWSARLTQTSADIKVTAGSLQGTSTTTAIRVIPNVSIKIGMILAVSGQVNKTITGYTNYALVSSNVLGSGSTYDSIVIATGLTASNVVGYTLLISGQKRGIISYTPATGVAVVAPGFTTLYSAGTSYSIINEKVGVVTVSAYGGAPASGTAYTIYSAFIDTINYFFKSRTLPVISATSIWTGLTLADSSGANITIASGIPTGFTMPLMIAGTTFTYFFYDTVTGIWTKTTPFSPTIVAGTAYSLANSNLSLTGRIGTFQGTYTQAQGVGVKYYTYNLYDESGILLDTTGQVYDGSLDYTYDAFLSGNDYNLELIVVTQENVTVTTGQLLLSVLYSEPDLKYPPTVTNLPDETAVELEWIQDKLAVPTATGTWAIVDDFPFVGTNSVNVLTGELIYDNISGNDFILNEDDFTVFTALTTPITNDGNLLVLADSTPSGYGELTLSIQDFKFYESILNRYALPDVVTELIAGTITTVWLLTATGIPTSGTGYIWSDAGTWDDIARWTETLTTDVINLKVTAMTDDITITEVTY